MSGHHDPIISAELFERAQQKLKNSCKKERQTGVRDFSSLIICGDCGSFYDSKVWHSTDRYRSIIYRCNNKYKGEKCGTPALKEERLKEMFVEATNRLVPEKEKVLEDLEKLKEMKSQTNAEDAIREAAVALEEAETAYKSMIE